ncbi:unnamed protein product [Ranitomeya imitator]|uniref:RRM domain-containing protein n=1 Tax=Ranitomeya imitator TaxID=111125 RepID=A0ABN9LBT5_9NEOB|nr:unnamed protein product [Ranitomeya imitator]
MVVLSDAVSTAGLIRSETTQPIRDRISKHKSTVRLPLLSDSHIRRCFFVPYDHTVYSIILQYGWFNVDDGRNTNVYVTGLPPDITNDEFIQIMSKCGIIMRDLQSEEYKIKLYKDKEGNLKGDGLCCYLKKESVQLALKLLDEYEIRGYKLHVENAKFQLKGEYDATKKKKKCKDYRKKLSLQQKQLDWRPEKKDNETRKRFERVIIIKNMFHPSDFEVRECFLQQIFFSYCCAL